MEIENRIRQFISTQVSTSHDSDGVQIDDNLFEKGIIDSAGLLAIVMFLETEFSITVPRTDLVPENFVTVESIGQYVISRSRSD